MQKSLAKFARLFEKAERVSRYFALAAAAVSCARTARIARYSDGGLAMNAGDAEFVKSLKLLTTDGNTAGCDRSATRPLTRSGTMRRAFGPAVESLADIAVAAAVFSSSEAISP